MSKPTLSATAALSVVMATSLLLTVADIAQANVIVSDPYNNGSYLALPTLVPGGPSANVHRTVLYNHGGAGPVQEGDDLQKVAETFGPWCELKWNPDGILEFVVNEALLQEHGEAAAKAWSD